MYIVFEGPDGTGKTTQISKMKEKLENEFPDREVLLTQELGSLHNEVCKDIREVFLKDSDICDRSALFLMLADRAQHIERVVSPALDRGAIVLSDRSFISTIVYHGAKVITTPSTGVPKNFYDLMDYSQKIQPDLCLIMTSDLSWGHKKIVNPDRIEKLGDDFHKTIHMLYNELMGDKMPVGMCFPACLMKTFPKYIYYLPKSSDNSIEQISKKSFDLVKSHFS